VPAYIWLSAMFATIRKHQKWLWAIIITGTIASFVIYFTPSASNRSGRSVGRESFGTINGHNISRKQYSEAFYEAKLQFLLQYGTWPDEAEAKKFRFSAEAEARNRLVLIEKLQEMNVKVDESSVAQWILDRFSDPRQPGSAKLNYENFVNRRLSTFGISQDAFETFIQHELGINHLLALAGVMGQVVTPREAAAVYRQEHEKIQAEAVTFSSTNFTAAVQVDPAALAQFYTNRLSDYTIPEKVQVRYIKFDLTNYLGKANEDIGKLTNLNQAIDQKYISSGPAFFTDTNGQVMPAEAAKAKIKQQFLEEHAKLLARKDVASFATELQSSPAVSATNLESLAATKGLPVLVSQPFAEFDSPPEFRLRPSPVQAGQAAFKLTPEQPFSQALVGEDGVYLLALDKKFPRQVEPLDSVRSRLTEDFIRSQSLKLARQAATDFYSHATNGLAQGKAFPAICAEEKVTPTTLPEFSAGSSSWAGESRLDLDMVKSAARNISPGKIAPMSYTRDGAFVLFVRGRSPVPDSEVKLELPKFLASLRQSEQYEAFNDWFSEQLRSSRIDTLKGKNEEE